MPIIRFWTRIALIAFFLSIARPSGAQVLYSSFGPSQSYNTTTALGVFSILPPENGEFTQVFQSIAAPFTPTGMSPTGKFRLTQIDVAVGGLGQFEVRLAADASGQPGTVLETWTIATPASPPIDTVTDALGIDLVAGQQYWVVVKPADLVVNDAWWLSPTLGAIPADVFGIFASQDEELISGGWQSCPAFITSCPATPAFDVLGTPVGFPRWPTGAGLGQIIRIVAGPVTPPPGSPVEVSLEFVDLNGNVLVPLTTVPVNPGQTASLDLNADQFIKQLSQRIEVIPIITEAPGPNAAPAVPLQASVEVFDILTGFGAALVPLAPSAAVPGSPSFAIQGLAGGQTMRLNLVAYPVDPCIATLSFKDHNGNPLGQSQQVSLAPGIGTSFDLNANTLGLKLGQRIEVQPIVTVTPPIGAAAAAPSACQASVEVFDHLTGRTWTYQGSVAQVPAVQ